MKKIKCSFMVASDGGVTYGRVVGRTLKRWHLSRDWHTGASLAEVKSKKSMCKGPEAGRVLSVFKKQEEPVAGARWAEGEGGRRWGWQGSASNGHQRPTRPFRACWGSPWRVWAGSDAWAMLPHELVLSNNLLRAVAEIVATECGGYSGCCTSCKPGR